MLVNDATTILPTHMLAIFGKPPPGGPRKVTLYPVHSLVLAAQCANLPKFPSALPVPLHERGQQEVEVPVFSICLPSPQSYPQLSRYLYTKQVDPMLRAFLPGPLPTAFMVNRDRLLVSFASDLASTFTLQTLAKYAINLHGLWQNVCALGIFDDDLWDAIDVMWQVLLTSLAVATGNPQMMIDPSSKTARRSETPSIRAVL